MQKLFVLIIACCSVIPKYGVSEITDISEKEALEDFFENLNVAYPNLINEFIEFTKTFDHQEAQFLNDHSLDSLNEIEFTKATLDNHPHANLNTKEIIERYEYKLEVHKVETEDGYILEVHRIKGNKTKSVSESKPVVFLMHGLLASSSDWVLSGPERGFAFILADAGYDVWLGNARGNKYSRSHKTTDPKNKKFWEFTWHEIGIYDLPVMIDYALNKSKKNDLIYIGHSQGSTSFFVMLSEKPEYNDKIKVMFSLAPVAFCTNMYSPILKYTAKFEKSLRVIVSPLGPWEFLPNRGLYKIISAAICKTYLQSICSNAMFLITGFNKEQMDYALIPAITAHFPAGSSVYQLFHYAQLINKDQFQQYNTKLIGSSNPPAYNFENMKVPISLYYGLNDWLAATEDVKTLHLKLPNCIGITEVNHKQFNHIDFLYAKDVKTLVYDGIVKTMSEYQNQ